MNPPSAVCWIAPAKSSPVPPKVFWKVICETQISQISKQIISQRLTSLWLAHHPTLMLRPTDDIVAFGRRSRLAKIRDVLNSLCFFISVLDRSADLPCEKICCVSESILVNKEENNKHKYTRIFSKSFYYFKSFPPNSITQLYRYFLCFLIEVPIYLTSGSNIVSLCPTSGMPSSMSRSITIENPSSGP